MNGSGRLYIATLFVASCCVCMAQHGKPYGLKTDFIENTEHYYKDGYPINTKVSAPQNDTLHYRAAWIRTVHPSFGWVIPNKGKNVKQTAFRIIVADNRKDISALRGNIYDSGMQYDGNSVAYVPENLITNDDLAKIVDTNDEWIRTRTGIRERRISSGEGTRHLAAKAAERALAAAGVAPEELDIIILGTSSPDRNYPSDACSVQAAIGAVNAVAFDISAACAGFIFAMNIVEGFFKAGIYKMALIIGAETLSKVTDWSDRGTCVLFGDGAGAAVLKAEETGIIDMMMGADGTKGDVLACTSRTVGNFLTGTKPELGFMTMDGQEVFKFAVRKVPESVMELLQRTGTKKEDIKYYVLHQANERIIEAAARRLKEPMEKFPMTIGQFGNTSTASIPLLLDDMIQKDMLKRGDKIIMSGFGAGMTWGAVLMEW